jgi:hypothetical protein
MARKPATVPEAAGQAAAPSQGTAVATADEGKPILFAMMKDAKKLGSAVGYWIKDYQDVGARGHALFISCIYHACIHGNPALLNQMYSALRSNDAGAARLYVRRIQIINGFEGTEPKDIPASEVVAAALEAGKVLDFAQNQFTVVKGHTSPEAKRLAKLCENRFLNPDGDKDKRVFDRNNFAEVRTLMDIDAIKQIEQSAQRLLEPGGERRKVTISSGVKKFLTDIRDKAGAMKNQLSLSEG